MSRNDPPLWVRGAAASLLLFASWWLLATDVLRGSLGDSVGAIGAGIVAFSLLQGMHLRFRLWPEGPWRKEFRKRAMLGVAVVLASLSLMARPSMTDALAQMVDPGTFLLCAVGAVAWGVGIGMVKQRSYLPWYGMAVVLALVPVVAGALAGHLVGEGGPGGLCLFAVPDQGPEVASAECGVAVVPAFAFLLGIGLASKLVTEELAFRRLLIGCGRRTGFAWVLGAAVVATAWNGILMLSGIGGSEVVIIGGLGAVAAGSLYVLSCSLLVSTAFSATLAAGLGAVQLRFAVPVGGTLRSTESATVQIVALALVAVALSALVLQRHGLVGSLVQED